MSLLPPRRFFSRVDVKWGPRPPKPRRYAFLDRWHHWVSVGEGALRCTQCLLISFDGEPSMLGCKGLPTCYKKLACAEIRYGHRLSVCMNDMCRPLVFCMLCGAYTQKRCNNLQRPCPSEPSQYGHNALQRIRQGLNPRCRSRGSVGPSRRSDASFLVSLAASAVAAPLLPESPRPIVTNDRLEALRARVAAREQANAARSSGC